jgi:DNA polymerase-1
MLDPFQIFRDEILYIVKSFQESKAVFAIDCPRNDNWRKDLYPEYKGNSEEVDPIFSGFKEECIVWLETKFPTVRYDKMEADDVIGSLALKYYPCYISTADNDFYQLLDNDKGIYMLKPNVNGGFSVFGSDQFKGLYGIQPNQFIDYKALVGDSADNFKGCAGIGKKGAIKLLTKYKTLDNIYTHLVQSNKDLTPKIFESLQKNKEYVYLCKKLATIVTNLPVSIE